MGFTQQDSEIRGNAIRIFEAGDGDPLVYLHGASGVPPWGPAFERLATDFRIILPEHPGFGTSPAPDWMRTPADVALHTLDLLDEFGLEEVALVGHSLGGWIAAEMACRTTARIGRLAVISAPGIRIKGTPVADNFMWSPEEAVRNVVHDQALAEQMLARTVSEEEQDLRLNNAFMTARLGWEPRWHNPALERWLHRIDVPTLVLWGAEDRFIPPAYAHRWAEHIPDARVEMIENCAHLPAIEKPAETAAALGNFLKGA